MLDTELLLMENLVNQSNCNANNTPTSNFVTEGCNASQTNATTDKSCVLMEDVRTAQGTRSEDLMERAASTTSSHAQDGQEKSELRMDELAEPITVTPTKS